MIYIISSSLFILLSKRLRRPGLEPGSTAWKATILTTRLTSQVNIILKLYFNLFTFENHKISL